MIVQYSQASSVYQESLLYQRGSSSEHSTFKPSAGDLNTDLASSKQSSNIVQLKSQSYTDEQSFTLFERRLASSQRSGRVSADQKLSSESEPVGRNSAQAVAESILSFISHRLEQDKKDGASDEQLQSRLDAGLKGFEKGFAQASEMLKDLDLMSDKVSADIGETYDLVHKGIDSIASDLGLKSPVAAAETTSSTTDDPVASPSPSPSSRPSAQPVGITLDTPDKLQVPSSLDSVSPGLAAGDVPGLKSSAFQAQSYQLDYARERSFQMEVKTQDGDTIRIDAASLVQYHESQQFAQGSGGDYAATSFSASEDYAAFISIDGDLDEDEWQAFTELFDQVAELADNFYQGDVAKAFEQALNLGYNSEEIAQFSVNLQQTTSVRQAAVYQAIEPLASPWSAVSNPISTLQDYAQELMATSQSMFEKGLSIDLLPDLMASTQEQADQQQQDFLKTVLGVE